MKQKHIPISKMSKRKRREYYAARRGDWGGVNPVTRKTPNLKAYNRKNPNNGESTSRCSDFLFGVKIIVV